MRVLLVEDDDALAVALTRALGRRGYTLERARTAAQARASATADIVLLDRGLPDCADGLDLVPELRARGAAVIALTRRRTAGDFAAGLTVADDYVGKPFTVEELLGRMASVRARRGPPAREHIRVGALELVPAQRRAALRGEPVALTAKQFDLLAALARHHGSVVPRTQLVTAVWGTTARPTSPHSLDQHISALRRRLGTALSIRTVHGQGFLLAATEEDGSAEEGRGERRGEG